MILTYLLTCCDSRTA